MRALTAALLVDDGDKIRQYVKEVTANLGKEPEMSFARSQLCLMPTYVDGDVELRATLLLHVDRYESRRKILDD